MKSQLDDWQLFFYNAHYAQVAQLVEHSTENRSVGGSIPPLGTSRLAITDYDRPMTDYDR